MIRGGGIINKRSLEVARDILTANYPLEILNQQQLDASIRLIEKRMSDEQKRKAKERRAAVLVPIASIRGELSVIFIKRSNSHGSHRGQISFPGGHVDEGETSVEAAVRELKEELGGIYDYTNAIDILGEAQTIPAMTGIPVTPIVAALTDEINELRCIFEPDPKEVEFVFSRNIVDLIDTETTERLVRMHSAPTYPGPEGKIWGLTSIILNPILHNVVCPAFQLGFSKL